MALSIIIAENTPPVILLDSTELSKILSGTTRKDSEQSYRKWTICLSRCSSSLQTSEIGKYVNIGIRGFTI